MLRLSVVTLSFALGACAALKPPPAAERTIEPEPAAATKTQTAPASAPAKLVANANTTATTPTGTTTSGGASRGAAIWPPRMPCGMDFEDVPLGKWADYQETYLGTTTIKERIALVAKGSEEVTVETTTEMRPGEKTVFATTFVPAQAGRWRVSRNVFQVEDDEPMEAPSKAAAQQPYPRADAKNLVGVETISVRAGTFKAKHYRYKTAYGERVDFWTDDTVFPIGVIKLEAEQKQLPAIGGNFVFELVTVGGGAIPQVTRAARAFDVTVVKKRGLPWGRQARLGPQPPAKVVQ